MTQAAHDDYHIPEGFEHCSKLDPVNEAPSALDRVKALVAILTGPDGCPWDGKQTNKSLIKPLLEETYEYIDALENGDRENMREELGDMLLQSIFQAQLCSQDPDDPFDLDEVCNRLVDKLITRHPQVFAPDGQETLLSGEDTLKLWEKMKQREKHRKSVLDGISKAQGALPCSAKVVSRVAKSEHSAELEQAFDMAQANPEDAYADRILNIVREANRNGIDIESALRNRLREAENRIVELEERP